MRLPQYLGVDGRMAVRLALVDDLRAMISLLPATQPINAVFNEAHRRVNLDAVAAQAPVENHLQKANAAMGIPQVPRFGHLKS